MNSVETRMMEAIDRNRKKIHKTGRKIWEFREVGWEEFNSSALLMDELEKEGFEVQRGLVGKHPKFDHKIDMPTAFKAVFKGKEGGMSLVSCLSMMLCPMAMPAAIILSHPPDLRLPWD